MKRRKPGDWTQSSGLRTQVLVQMTPEERAALEQIAELEMRSLSATTRMLLLGGLRAYQRASEA